MPWKIQPIRMQEAVVFSDSITPNLPIVRCAYVALIVLASVFSMAWYSMQLKARVYTEKIQVTCGIFHGLPLESVA